MKKIALFLVLSLFIVSCSSDDDSNGGISDSPVSGKLYGTDFTMGGGKGAFIDFFGDDSVRVYLTAEDFGCETPGTSDFPITITAPNVVGVHTTGVYVTFNDPNSTDFISVSGGLTVEIISLTDDLVVGKVKAASGLTDNSIEGKFEVVICE